MSKTGIIIVAILVTLGLTYGLSLLLTRRKTKTGGSVSADDWEVGVRELPLYVVVGTQFATAMGGGILVGQVGNGFNNGLTLRYPLPARLYRAHVHCKMAALSPIRHRSGDPHTLYRPK